MKFLRKKKAKQIWIFAIAILCVILAWLIFKPKDLSSNIIKVQAKMGTFVIDVTSTGELEAKTSENLVAPNVREIGINSVKIEHIVPNGTIVKKGDYVASLSKSEILGKIREKQKEIEKFKSELITTQLDTTLNLKNARNELLNKSIEMEEIELELEQSIYEPPATIRQIEIKLDRFKRTFSQSQTSYLLKVEKEKARMNDVTYNLEKSERELARMREIIEEFTIIAPKEGMVVHPRGYSRSGRSIIGRELSMHNPVVATLPNLNELISRTHINEIDISKIKTGQKVKIGVDAFPDKMYEGVVTKVANMGNQYMMGSAKLFEVIIELKNSDHLLKPSMTTKNSIIIETFENALSVPIECIHNDDQHSFVFTGRFRKEIKTGASNDNEIIILNGLIENEEVCLGTPENTDSFRFVKLQPQNI